MNKKGVQALGKYKNKLGLEGIPRIAEIRPQKTGLFFTKADEFKHLTDTLKEWRRQRISLAVFIEDEELQEAVLSDLYKLRDLVDAELREERSKPAQEQIKPFIGRREYFLKETFPYEEGQLLAWQAPVSEQRDFYFVNLEGVCRITFHNGAVIKLTLELKESGLFSIGWRSAGDMSGTDESIAKNIKVEKDKAREIKFLTPKQAGRISIFNHISDVVDYVPV